MEGGVSLATTTCRALSPPEGVEDAASSQFQEDSSLVPHGQGAGGGEQRQGGWSEASRATAPLSAGPGLGGRDSDGGTELSSRWLPTQGPRPPGLHLPGAHPFWKLSDLSLEARHTRRKEPPSPTGAPCGQALGSLGFGVRSHTRWRGPGGGAGTGHHLAALTLEEGSPWIRTRRPWRVATGALFLPPNQQLNCRGNVAAASTRTRWALLAAPPPF